MEMVCGGGDNGGNVVCKNAMSRIVIYTNYAMSRTVIYTNYAMVKAQQCGSSSPSAISGCGCEPACVRNTRQNETCVLAVVGAFQWHGMMSSDVAGRFLDTQPRDGRCVCAREPVSDGSSLVGVPVGGNDRIAELL